EEVQLEHEVRHEAEADHGEQLDDRENPAEQELADQHGDRLACDLRPAESREPLDVDPVALGNQRGAWHARTLAWPQNADGHLSVAIYVSPVRAYCLGASSVLRPLSSTHCW